MNVRFSFLIIIIMNDFVKKNIGFIFLFFVVVNLCSKRHEGHLNELAMPCMASNATVFT